MVPKTSQLNSIMFTILSKCSEDFIFIEDAESNHFRWSSNAVETLGLESEYFENSHMWKTIIHPEDFESFYSAYQRLICGAQLQINNDYRFKVQNGAYIWMHFSGWYVGPECGTPTMFAGIISDFAPHSTIDSVTNLKGNYDFRIALESIAEQDTPWGILILGIDEFKGINDLYSYSFGDKVLGTFARKMKEILPDGALLYRLDGDGFGVLFQTEEEAMVLRYYRSLQKLGQVPMLIDGRNISLTLSGGVSLYPADGKDDEMLYRNARIALRTAKSRGKNQLVSYSDEILSKEHFSMRLMGDLRESIKMGFQGFSLKYQPLVRAKNRELYGCEVLLRWNHPDFPQGVSPYEFIPVLEGCGLIIEVGKWVLESAVKQCAEWNSIMPTFQMNINVSSSQFEEPDFKFFVVDILTKYGVNPSAITLELTESGRIINPKEMQNVFDFVRGQGIKIAFDDFGTGYASLGIFRVLSADELKIDRSFLERLSYDVTDQKIITQIVNLCHSMNMTVCVEGIENPEIEEIVRQLGPELLQGYYYNCPMTQDEFTKFYFAPNKVMERTLYVAEKLEQESNQIRSCIRPVQPMSMEEVVDNAYAGIFQVGMDPEFTFLTCNEGYRRMLGYTSKEIDEQFKNHALSFVHPDDRQYVKDEIRRQLNCGDTVNIEFRVVKSDGTPIWIIGTGNVVKSRHGESSLVVVIIEDDYNKKKNLEMEEFYSIAFTGEPSDIHDAPEVQPQFDDITGLFNKGATEKQISDMLLASKPKEAYALYLIDIDDFRNINSEMGHINGDKVICEMALRLQALFSEESMLGRVGGDEFLVFVPYDGCYATIIDISEWLISELRKEFMVEQMKCVVSVSMGVACYPKDGVDFYTLLSRAESALYRTKELGKDGYCLAAN